MYTMKKRYSFLLLPFLALSVGLSACQNNEQQNKDDFEEEMEKALEGDTYEWYYEPSYSDPIDITMSIDGVLDEPVWNKRNWLHHSEKGANLSYTTYFTEYGLYVAAIAEDTHIQWHSRFYFPTNSSFWFNIKSKDTQTLHATEVYNFFVDQYNSASRNLARYQAKSHTYYDKDGNANKMTAELFVSWKAINIHLEPGELYPEFIRINPHYRYIENLNSVENGWIRPLFFFDDDARQVCSGRFDKDGYIAYERDEAPLGNAANGMSKSDGWILDAVDDGIVTSCGPHSQAIFFKDIYSSHYSFKTQMLVKGGIQDTYPSAGVCNMKNEIYFDAFNIIGNDILSSASAYNAHHLSLYKNGGAGWVDKSLFAIPNNGSQVLTIQMIKDDSVFHYIVDGVYYGSENIAHLNGKSCPGLYTLGCEAMFFNFEAIDYDDDLDGLEEELLKYVCPINVSYSEGGYASAVTPAAKYGESTAILLQPDSGYAVSNFEVKDPSGNVLYDFDYYLSHVIDSMVSIDDIQSKLNVYVEFALIEGERTRIIGTMVSDKDDSPIANADFAFVGHDPRLYFPGKTGNTGGLSVVLPKPGISTCGGYQINCDGVYDVYITNDGTLVYATTITLTNESPNTLRDIIVRAPNIKLNRDMNKTLKGSKYVYENRTNVFKMSAYEYTGTYANDAIFSVEVSNGSAISAGGNWAYYLGIIMTQGEIVDPSITKVKDLLPNGTYMYRNVDNPGNEFYGVHVGITQTGFGSSVGTVYTNFQNITCNSLIGDANPHTRLVTVALHANRIYYYLDNNYLGAFPLNANNYRWDVTNGDDRSFTYAFKNDLPVMFGVNATNCETPAVEFRIMTELYGAAAISEMSTNSVYSNINI